VKDNESVIRLWMEFASNVSDPQVVYKHMFDAKVGRQTPRLYTSWAIAVEKYERNFGKSSEVYQLGLYTIEDEERKEELLAKYKQFADRMGQRIQRDVHGYLPQAVVETIKKRTYKEAFGAEASTQKDEKRLLLDHDVRERAVNFG